MGFSRQEYWSGLPFPSPGGLPDPGIEPRSPALEAEALTSEPPGKPRLRTEPMVRVAGGLHFQRTTVFETTKEQITNERFGGFVVVLNHI